MDDNKKSTTIWLRPSVISRMDGWLEADNCQSRSEFVDTRTPPEICRSGPLRSWAVS